MGEMTDGHPRPQRPLEAATERKERPVLPTGALRRTGRLAMLPLRHAGRTAAAASRLSRSAGDQAAARPAEQLFATVGELKGGAAKLGQAMSVFEAAMPEEVAAPYRSALPRLTDAAPARPAEVARRVAAADLAVAYGPGWRERLVAFNDMPTAAASIGQVHRGRWRADGGQIVDVAVKGQYPGVGKALRSDLRQARLLARGMARLPRLKVSGLAGRPPGPTVRGPGLVGAGRGPAPGPAAAPRRRPGAPPGMRDSGAVAATPGGIPAPFGQLAAAVIAGDGPAVVSLAQQVGALPPDAELDPQLILELLHPIAATGAADSFTYSRPWLRRLMAHLPEPRLAPAVRKLTPPPEYALVWRATLSAAGLFAQLGATVPTRGLHLAYSPGFRSGTPPAPAAAGAAASRAS